MLTDYIPILIILIFSMLLAASLLLISNFLGPRRYSKKKLTPYECGITPMGDARDKFSVNYYLVAALFILFDVEVVFVFAWAVVFKKLGVLAFVEIVAFFIVILGGYFYVIKKGALEWE
ncbi:MAG TPA: NADH-quinone oxidoreductase subunit A [Thermodesulfobacteriota bacterium]